jgi:hypothetical protein
MSRHHVIAPPTWCISPCTKNCLTLQDSGRCAPAGKGRPEDARHHAELPNSDKISEGEVTGGAHHHRLASTTIMKS